MHLARCGKRTEVMSVSNLRQSDYVDNIWRSQHAVIIVMCENMQEFQKWVRGHALIRSRRFYSISIGSVCRNGSITNSESSFTGVCTVQLHRISLPSFNEWLTWSPGGVCGRHRRQLSSSRLLGAARLATVRFRRQHLVYGTVCRPPSLSESPSLAVFKRQLKTHLFTASYFSNWITNSSLNCFIFLC